MFATRLVSKLVTYESTLVYETTLSLLAALQNLRNVASRIWELLIDSSKLLETRKREKFPLCQQLGPWFSHHAYGAVPMQGTRCLAVHEGKKRRSSFLRTWPFSISCRVAMSVAVATALQCHLPSDSLRS